jgi:seryl-tRNA synthetase
MLDINLIRKEPDMVRNALLKRMSSVDFTELLDLDNQKRGLILDGEKLKSRKNEVSANIPELKKEGKDISELLEEMKQVADSIKSIDIRLNEVSLKLQQCLEVLPNMPGEDVASGGKENNEVIRVWGNKPNFSFKTKDHIRLSTELDLIDYECGVKMGGTGFWLYKGDGACWNGLF